MKGDMTMHFRKYVQIFIATAAMALLSGCGNGTCLTNQNSTGDAKFTLTAPNLYPAGVAESIPLIITNTSNNDARELSYTVDINSNTTGIPITIAEYSQTNCASVAAHQSCQIVAQVPAGSHPGAFTILATPHQSGVTKLIDNVKTLFKHQLNDATISVSASIGLIDLPTNTASGADGLSLYYPSSIVANATGDTQVIITVINTSVNSGDFNTINLVDNSGKRLSYTVLTGNSGNGSPNIGYNSTVTFLVTIPQGAPQLQFKPQIETNGSNITAATNLKTILINSATSPLGILSIQPNYFNLSPEYKTQTITYTNIGNGAITNLVSTPSTPLAILDGGTCGTSLAAGMSCTYRVTYAESSTSGSAGIIANYNSTATTASSANIQVNYTGVIHAGLIISGNTPPPFVFSATVESPSVSYQMTLTNTGRLDETVTDVTLPPNIFTTNRVNVNNPCGRIPFVLAANTSCNINVVYTNSTAMANPISDFVTVGYSYGENQTAITNAAISYQTTPSAGILSVLPSPIGFPTVVINNNVESSIKVVEISNIGNGQISNLAFSLSGSNSSLFSIINNSCSAVLESNSSCSITVKFGPFGDSVSAGQKSASLDITYSPFANTPAVVNNTIITAQSATAASALIGMTLNSSANFSSGDGSYNSPYLTTQNSTAGTVTYQIQNSGNGAATNFYVAMPNSLWSIESTNSTCGSANVPITLNVNSSCIVQFKLNTSTLGNQNLDLSTMQMNWIDEKDPSGVSQNGTGTVYATVQAPLSANILVSATYPSWDNDQTGGTLTNPLLLHYIGNNLPQAFIDITYTNTGNGAANNFTASYSPLPNGWTVRISGCNGVTLIAAGGSCTDEYRFTAPQDIHATGTEFNNNNVLVSWNDGTAHTNQVLTLPAGTVGVGGYNTNNVIYNAVYLDMFVSFSTHDGQFSTASGGNDAINNADLLCAVDANNPQVSATYKALIVAAESSLPTLANSRYACTTQSCNIGESYNWVLQPNLRYASLSNYEQLIGTTNESSVFPSGTTVRISTTANTKVWTGLAQGSAPSSQTNGYYDWMTSYPGYTLGSGTIRGNCNNWTSNVGLNWSDPLSVGDYARADQTGYNSFAISSNGCSNTNHIYCVQQP